ncbi:MAG TPA: formylmethanofuran dehydrogenase, partial [Pelotomaculum sp.]|nr:formylmethanofuran dehydrogenase [Pelotomaculum sp.]
PEFLRLRSKVEEEVATPIEAEQYRKMLNEKIEKLLSQPEEEILEWRIVDIEIPEKARLFNSIQCTLCGEKTSEGHARIKDGKPVCRPCAGEYTRGW